MQTLHFISIVLYCNAKISNFFAPQGRTPCPMSMKSVGFMRVSVYKSS